MRRITVSGFRDLVVDITSSHSVLERYFSIEATVMGCQRVIEAGLVKGRKRKKFENIVKNGPAAIAQLRTFAPKLDLWLVEYQEEEKKIDEVLKQRGWK